MALIHFDIFHHCLWQGDFVRLMFKTQTYLLNTSNFLLDKFCYESRRARKGKLSCQSIYHDSTRVIFRYFISLIASSNQMNIQNISFKETFLSNFVLFYTATLLHKISCQVDMIQMEKVHLLPFCISNI